MLAGDEELAWELFRSAKAIEEELGRRSSWRLVHQAQMLLWLERFDEAAEILPGATATARERGSWQNVGVTLSWSAMALARLGRLDDAQVAAAEAREAAIEYEGLEPLVRSDIAFADIGMARGDPDAALRAADAAVRNAARGDWVLLQIDAWRIRARARRAAGRVVEAMADERVADELAAAKGVRLATLARGTE
jgi:tetratricopeptide (TPR) repeat protein